MYLTNNEISTINQYLSKNKVDFNKEIGKIIKNEKNYKKMNNSSLAERAFISPLYLTQIENGKYNISLLKFISICNSLEVYPNQLLEPFLVGCKKEEDRFFYLFQKDKNISKNIIEYIKENMKCDYKLFNN